MKQNFTSTIAGASIFITAVLLIGRGLGLIREVIFANYFGLSAEYDLYLVATVLPITINSIVLYIAQNYFIPNYSSAQKNSEREAINFTGFSIWLFFFGGLIISAILFGLSKKNYLIKYSVFIFQMLRQNLLNPQSAYLELFLSPYLFSRRARYSQLTCKPGLNLDYLHYHSFF